jgi:ubiquinone/menaquinone biosynthesis C-methylase UbiE
VNLVIFVLLFGLQLSAQVADKANERYRKPEGRASMLGNLGAADRADRIQAAAIVKALSIRPGQHVADLGTGGGALLPLLSQAVGPQGKVFAQDIYEDFLAAAKKKAGEEKLPNVEFVKGTDRNAMLKPKSVDLVVTVDAYHHFDYPAEVLASLKTAMKPGGRFAIVDYYKRPGAMAGVDAVEHIRLDLPDVIKEVTGYGWKLVEERVHVPNSQYIAVFTPAQ